MKELGYGRQSLLRHCDYEMYGFEWPSPWLDERINFGKNGVNEHVNVFGCATRVNFVR